MSLIGILFFDKAVKYLWKDGATLERLLCSKKVKKYNVDNFLLQLVGTGVAKIVAPDKIDNKDNSKKDDCIFMITMGHNCGPCYLIREHFHGMNLFPIVPRTPIARTQTH